MSTAVQSIAPVFFEYRKRVIEDAYELVAAVEVSEPLTLNAMDDLRRVGNWEVPLFLRRLLTRSVILTMLRLLENSQPGKTGTTAGITAFAAVAEGSGALTPMQRAGVDLALTKIRNDMIADEIPVDYLSAFRHAHIGHTLIPHQALANDLRADIVFKHARAIIAVIEEIEKMFAANGVQLGSPVLEKPSDWKRRSADFWRHLT
jgi:hypothetical protein